MSAQRNAQLFHELAQLARSGMPVLRALEIVARNPGHRLAHCARQLLQGLQVSGSISGAFREAKFPESDAAVIEAAEATGRLEQVYLELEQYYSQLAQSRRTIVARSLYPLVVLHLGVFLLAIPQAILGGGWAAYWKSVVPVLLVIYAALFLLGLAWVAIRRAVARRVTAARCFLSVPVLGGFLQDWTAWKFASVLSLYVRAGGGLLKAVEAAGRACDNASLRQTSQGALELIRGQGVGLSEAFRLRGPLPEVLDRALEVGEHSGRLDEETLRAAEILKGRTLGRLETLGEWTPKIIYIAVVLFVGWRIISMATGVASSIEGTLNSLE
jgi:Type II secretory pathway, component PulF